MSVQLFDESLLDSLGFVLALCTDASTSTCNSSIYDDFLWLDDSEKLEFVNFERERRAAK